MAEGEVLEAVTDYYPVEQTIPALMWEIGQEENPDLVNLAVKLFAV